VVTAYDGKEALEKIATEKPDLVVLDVMMPYMDGFEVLQQLRKNPETRDLPVIMLTAKAQDTDVFRGYTSGVDLYLTKPFNPMELVSFVKRIFSSMESNDGGNVLDLG
jgi:two-component system alkaline phosphatase synthesis response regulator PhoP/two-component system response regulator VicR